MPLGKTRITIHYDVGFDNLLFLRGEGLPDTNWKHGIPLKNIGTDSWVFETDQPFEQAEFKVLINDQLFELGENHKIVYGGNLKIYPRF